MYSDLECGICYRVFNAGRRCPRELRCGHSFCESCLRALSRPKSPEEAAAAAAEGADRPIVCPLCRHATPVSGEQSVRAELPVDERVLERLLHAEVLYQEDPDDDDEEEEEELAEEGGGSDGCDRSQQQEATLPETPAEESDSFAASGGGRLRRSLRKVWWKISGKHSRPRNEENCISDADVRHLAMMACYMF